MYTALLLLPLVAGVLGGRGGGHHAIGIPADAKGGNLAYISMPGLNTNWPHSNELMVSYKILVFGSIHKK